MISEEDRNLLFRDLVTSINNLGNFDSLKLFLQLVVSDQTIYQAHSYKGRNVYQILLEGVLLRSLKLSDTEQSSQLIEIYKYNIEKAFYDELLLYCKIRSCFEILEELQSGSIAESACLEKLFSQFKKALDMVEKREANSLFILNEEPQGIIFDFIAMLVNIPKISYSYKEQIIGDQQCLGELLRLLLLMSGQTAKIREILIKRQEKVINDSRSAEYKAKLLEEWAFMMTTEKCDPISIIGDFIVLAHCEKKIPVEQARAIELWSQIALRKMREHGAEKYEQPMPVYSTLLEVIWSKKIRSFNDNIPREKLSQLEKELQGECERLPKSHIPLLYLSHIYLFAHNQEKHIETVFKAYDKGADPEIFISLYFHVGKKGFHGREDLKQIFSKIKSRLIDETDEAIRRRRLVSLVQTFLRWGQPGAIVDLLKDKAFVQDIQDDQNLLQSYLQAKTFIKQAFSAEEREQYDKVGHYFVLHNIALETEQEKALALIENEFISLSDSCNENKGRVLIEQLHFYTKKYYFSNDNWMRLYKEGKNLNENNFFQLILLYEKLREFLIKLQNKACELIKQVDITLLGLYCFAQMEESVLLTLANLQTEERFKVYLENIRENQERSFHEKCQIVFNGKEPKFLSDTDIEAITQHRQNLEAQMYVRQSEEAIHNHKELSRQKLAEETGSTSKTELEHVELSNNEEVELDNDEIVNLKACPYFESDRGRYYVYLSEQLTLNIDLYERDVNGGRLYEKDGFFAFKQNSNDRAKQFIAQVVAPKFAREKGQSGIKPLNDGVFEIKIRGKERILGINLPIKTQHGERINLLYFTDYCRGSKKGNGESSVEFKRIANKLKEAQLAGSLLRGLFFSPRPFQNLAMSNANSLEQRFI